MSHSPPTLGRPFKGLIGAYRGILGGAWVCTSTPATTLEGAGLALLFAAYASARHSLPHPPPPPPPRGMGRPSLRFAPLGPAYCLTLRAKAWDADEALA